MLDIGHQVSSYTQLKNTGQEGFLNSTNNFCLLDSPIWSYRHTLGFIVFQWGFSVGMMVLLLAGRLQVYTTNQAQFHPPYHHPLHTYVSHPGKLTSNIPPIPECLSAQTTHVLLKIITRTYTNAYILLN